MCKSYSRGFRCGHKKVWFKYCRKVTLRQCGSKQPCESGLADLPIPYARDLGTCCSTACCHAAFDGRDEDLKLVEKTYDIGLDQPWKTRKIKVVAPTSKPEVGFNRAIQSLEGEVHFHYKHCLPRYARDDVISNEHRIELGLPLYEPRPPRLPHRRAVQSLLESPPFLATIATWESYERVIKDKQLFEQHNPVLGEERLHEVENTLNEMCRKPHGVFESYERHDELLALQNHLENAQPFSSDSDFYALQYVMRMRRYEFLRKRMNDLLVELREQYDSGRASDDIYQVWHLTLENVREAARQLTISSKNCFSEHASQSVRISITILESNTDAYNKARQVWLSSQKDQGTKQSQSKGVLSS